jgi:hypothetical protein
MLPATGDPFEALLASARFEDLGKGRRGTVLVRCTDGAVPIVRTTTPYQAPTRPFRAIHERLAEDLRPHDAPVFNNALLEHYTHGYATMKQHSDQALDLADASSIAIYSCYRDPDRPSRRLIVKSKSEDTSFEILLAHGSVVVFSLETNRRFTHAIALADRALPNDWLGITFRTSKTFVRGVGGQPCFADGTRLVLADEDQRRAYFQMRRRENDEPSFTYPAIPYTISESDLRAPEE